MGWNGSDSKVGAAVPAARNRKSNDKGVGAGLRSRPESAPYRRGVFAGLIVVALGGAAVWWFVGRGRSPSAPQDGGEGTRRPAKISEATPQIATNKAVETEEVATKPKELPPQRVGETRDGKILLPSGRLHIVKGVITNRSGQAHYQIFDHPSENVIAGLLSVEPGQTLIGSPRYTGLTADFLESLKTPIVPSHDDSEHDRELKRAVNEAKIELKAAYDRGEDIEKILRDARQELQKLGRYKQELKAMAIKGLDECASEAEMEDTISAANKMLEEKGIAPMDLSPIAKIRFRMKQEKENKQ